MRQKKFGLLSMIKGLRALFSSKVILNPFVLMGIFYGLYLNGKFEAKEVFYELKKFQIYVLVLIFAMTYNIFIKKHLKLGGEEIDWEQTSIAILGSFFRFLISCFLTISFINFLSF